MSHKNILDSDRTALIIVDFQEAFREMIPGFDEIAISIYRLVRGFEILGLPIIVTEQYPKGLGRTAKEVLDVLPEGTEIIEKTAFSSCGAAGFVQKLKEAGIRQALVCGLETHICVNQTVHDLLDFGFEVHLLTDGVGSRFNRNRETGLQKIMNSGGIPSNVEMALFELMKDAKHTHFKEIQALIK